MLLVDRFRQIGIVNYFAYAIFDFNELNLKTRFNH